MRRLPAPQGGGAQGAPPVRGLLASPLGFLIGLSLGALGGGGSVLAVPALVYGAGQGARAATTTSLLVVGATALAGMVSHRRAGRVRVRAGLMFGLVGSGGALLGSLLNRSVDPDVLLLAFSVLMVGAAWQMWRRQQTSGEPVADPPGAAVAVEAPPVTRASPVRVLVAATGVGLVTGFFGVGGGFVVVPALVMALGFDMSEAVGTSLLVIVLNSAVALSTRVATSGIDWGIALPFTIAGVLGATGGSRIADRVPSNTLVRWFVWLLVVVALYTGARSAAAL